MAKTTRSSRPRRVGERPSPRPLLRAVPDARDEEAAVVALLSRIRPRPKPWSPPPAA